MEEQKERFKPDQVFTGTITVSGSTTPTTNDSFTVQINVRGLTPPASGTLAVTVAAGYEELIVYTCPMSMGGYERVGEADECLYLYSGCTGTLPQPPANTGYIAVDLMGARTHDKFVNTRGLIKAYVGKMKGAGQQPDGPGPVHSYP